MSDPTNALRKNMRVDEMYCDSCRGVSIFVWKAGEPELDRSKCKQCDTAYPEAEPSPFVVTAIDRENRVVTIGLK